jgi:hypothetical protein
MESKILKEQLQKLSTAHFKTVGNVDITLPFDEVVFCKKESPKSITRICFEDYIVHPFGNFTFHDTWNNGIPPPRKIMYGDIDNETKGMYHFICTDETNENSWEGWIPKKSCKIDVINCGG